MSGVGISFGADRIYDVLKGLDKFPKDIAGSATVLFANMDSEALAYIIPVVKSLREAGVSCEIYPTRRGFLSCQSMAGMKPPPAM